MWGPNPQPRDQESHVPLTEPGRHPQTLLITKRKSLLKGRVKESKEVIKMRVSAAM